MVSRNHQEFHFTVALTYIILKSSGAKVDYRKLIRIHMIAGLTEGKCSMIGAWGSATVNGSLLQLRALGNHLNYTCT